MLSRINMPWHQWSQTMLVGHIARRPSLQRLWNMSSYSCLLFVVGHNNSCNNSGHHCCFLYKKITIMTNCWLTDHQQTNKRETVMYSSRPQQETVTVSSGYISWQAGILKHNWNKLRGTGICLNNKKMAVTMSKMTLTILSNKNNNKNYYNNDNTDK